MSVAFPESRIAQSETTQRQDAVKSSSAKRTPPIIVLLAGLGLWVPIIVPYLLTGNLWFSILGFTVELGVVAAIASLMGKSNSRPQ